jgi:phage shock protein PspC (stress-responsive transcriptional regulator)
MKKTLTANISGTVFHIEEDAYERLHRYLESIRSQFTGSAGRDEIMSDIEARIAELLSERLDGKREVVSIGDVDHVIGIMGQPEDYVFTEETAGGAEIPPPGSGGPNWTYGQPRRKRLFRDPDDKWIGGVLGGIGAYFNFDPLILRIIYIVLLFLGVGWLIYIILWIVVPVATTAAEKLEMRGEPVNVENLKRVFEEGADRVRTGAQTFSREAQEMGRKYGPTAKRGADEVLGFFGELIRVFFVVFAKIVGVVLLLGGAALAVLLMVLLLGEFSIVGFPDAGGTISNFHDLALLVLGDHSWTSIAWIALIGFILAPVIGLIHGGISLLFNIAMPKWFGYTLTSVWIISIIILSVVGIRIGSDMRVGDTVETRHDLTSDADLITITCSEGGQTWEARHENGFDRIRINGDNVDLGWAKLDVRQSPDTLYHLVIQRRARGNNYKSARDRATSIEAGWTLENGTLDLAPWFNFDRGDLFRDQKVRYILEVPVGRSVHFDESVGGMLHDVHNTTNTWDKHMVEKTWLMTERGLAKEGEVDTEQEIRRKYGLPGANEEKQDTTWHISIGRQRGKDAAISSKPALEMPDLLGVLLKRV